MKSNQRAAGRVFEVKRDGRVIGWVIAPSRGAALASIVGRERIGKRRAVVTARVEGVR